MFSLELLPGLVQIWTLLAESGVLRSLGLSQTPQDDFVILLAIFGQAI